MLKILITVLFLTFGAVIIQAQDVKALKSLQPDKEFENILVQQVYSDEYTSTFVIWVKKGVKAHRHVEHTEQVGVLEGKAEMTIGDKTIIVKKGDWVTIPRGTVHAVKVLSKKPIKVISIQSPQFKGKDRVFVE